MLVAGREKADDVATAKLRAKHRRDVCLVDLGDHGRSREIMGDHGRCAPGRPAHPRAPDAAASVVEGRHSVSPHVHALGRRPLWFGLVAGGHFGLVWFMAGEAHTSAGGVRHMATDGGEYLQRARNVLSQGGGLATAIEAYAHVQIARSHPGFELRGDEGDLASSGEMREIWRAQGR